MREAWVYPFDRPAGGEAVSLLASLGYSFKRPTGDSVDAVARDLAARVGRRRVGVEHVREARAVLEAAAVHAQQLVNVVLQRGHGAVGHVELGYACAAQRTARNTA